MSLDLCLQRGPETLPCACECGHEHTRVDVDSWSTNITHNLRKMAEEAGIYGWLWRPEEAASQPVRAQHLIDPLVVALDVMRREPARFRQFDAPNGWGTLDQFVPWLEELLTACRDYPEAVVRASR